MDRGEVQGRGRFGWCCTRCITAAVFAGVFIGVFADRGFIFLVLGHELSWDHEFEDVFIASVSDVGEVVVNTSVPRHFVLQKDDANSSEVSSSPKDGDDPWNLHAAAFWRSDLRVVRMQALQRRETVERAEAKCLSAFCSTEKVCQIRNRDGSLFSKGVTWIMMGSLEDTPVGNDQGASLLQKQFAKAHNANETFRLFPMLTVHIECVLDERLSVVHEHLHLHVELEKAVITSGVIAFPPKRKLHKRLAVCGRAIVGKYEAKEIALHIENNIRFGVEVLFLYKVGLSSIEDEDIFDTYIKNGQLVLVDLRSELQRRHGIDAGWVVWNTKAFMQSYLRKDCMDRLTQHDVDWVGFLDIDEFLTFNILDCVGSKYDAIKVVMLEPKNSSRFCESEEKKLEPGRFKGGLTKPFFRPAVVSFEAVSVHEFQNYLLNLRTKLLNPEKDGFIYHNRCINRLAFIDYSG